MQLQQSSERLQAGVDGIGALLVTPLGEVPFRSQLLGRFNLANILAAVAAGYALELPLEAIRRGIEGNKQVPGRLEGQRSRMGISLAA